MPSMTGAEDLLAEIEKFLRKHGMAPSTFGFKAVHDGKTVDRLRAGKTITMKTAAKIREYMRAYEAAPRLKKVA